MLDLMVWGDQVATPGGVRPLDIGVQRQEIVASGDAGRVIPETGKIVIARGIERHTPAAMGSP